MPVRAGMRMDAGSVTRKRKAVLIYKAAAHGWDDGGGEDDFYKHGRITTGKGIIKYQRILWLFRNRTDKSTKIIKRS